jgi:hypothetical protein
VLASVFANATGELRVVGMVNKDLNKIDVNGKLNLYSLDGDYLNTGENEIIFSLSTNHPLVLLEREAYQVFETK